MVLRLIQFILILLITAVTSKSQPVWDVDRFVRFSIKDGLIDNEVHYVQQDDLGYIWAGTENGISRYNGLGFSSYSYISDPQILKGNYIESLKNLDGRLLIFAREGFSSLNPTTMQSKHYNFEPSLNSEHKNSAFDAVSFEDGSHAYTTSTGFFLFDKTGKSVFEYHHFKSSDLKDKRIFFGQEIIKLNEHELLFYAQDIYLYHYDKQLQKLTQIKTDSASKWTSCLPWNNVLTIKKQISKDKLLLLAFKNYAYKIIDLKSGTVISGALPKKLSDEFYWNSYITQLDSNQFAISCVNNGFFTFSVDWEKSQLLFSDYKNLPGIRCYHVYKDKDMRLWIATSKGLLMEKDKPPVLKSYNLLQNSSDKKNLYISWLEQFGDTLLIGTANGKTGIILYDLKNKRGVRNYSFSDTEDNNINFIRKLSNGMAFINTNIGNHYFNLKSGRITPASKNLPRRVMFPMNHLGTKEIMYAYDSGELYQYDFGSDSLMTFLGSISSNLVKNNIMYLSESGILWCAGRGLIAIKPNGDMMEIPSIEKALKGGRALSLLCEGNEMWIGTSLGSLLHYNIASGQLSDHVYDEHYRFPVGSLSSLIDHVMYMGAGDKFYAYNVENKSTTELSKSIEFPEEKIMAANFVFNTDSSALLTATVNHLIEIAKPTVAKIFEAPIISTILFNGEVKLHHPGDVVEIRYDNELIDIAVSNLGFSTDPIVNEYKVDDGVWHQVKDQITLNSIDFGSHSILLRSSTIGGKSSTRIYQMYLAPPFFKSILFYILLSCLIMGIIALYVWRRIRQNKELYTLNQRIAESELKALHSQMNPHFIFNSLNSIKSLILYQKSEEASRYLSTFSALIRQNLNHSRMPFITLHDQILYLRQYSEMEKLRFPDLQIEIYVCDDVEDQVQMIPPMILQPIVENAIRYSSANKTGSHKVIIRVYTEEEYMICSVEDFGLGIDNMEMSDQVKGNSISLQNIGQRIQLYNRKYTLNGQLIIIDKKTHDMGTQGTMVVFKYIKYTE